MRTKSPNTDAEYICTDPWDSTIYGDTITLHNSFVLWLLKNLDSASLKLYLVYLVHCQKRERRLVSLPVEKIHAIVNHNRKDMGYGKIREARKKLQALGLIKDRRRRNRKTGHVRWMVEVRWGWVFSNDEGKPALAWEDDFHRVIGHHPNSLPKGGKLLQSLLSPKGDKKGGGSGPSAPDHLAPLVSGREEKITPKQKYKQRHLNLSKRVIRHQLEQFPTMGHAIKSSPPEKGAEILSQLERIDGWAWEDIKAVVLWAIDDTRFWNRQVLTCGSLRNKRPGGDRTKFMKIYQQWISDSEEGRERSPERQKKIPNPSPGMLHAIFAYLEEKQTEEMEQAVLRSTQSLEKFINNLPEPTKKVMNRKWTAVVTDYAQWLTGQKWALKGRGIGYFSSRSAMWSKYFSTFTRSNHIPYPKN